MLYVNTIITQQMMNVMQLWIHVQVMEHNAYHLKIVHNILMKLVVSNN